MSGKIPFFLSEAVLTLYPAGADGSAITAAPVWCGALANRFRAVLDYDEVKIMGSGARYATANHVDEETIITIGKTWILRKASSLTDFKPGRNQQYVLQVVWNAGGYWFVRTFYGVTGRSVTFDAPNTNQFLTDQVFHAQYFTDAGGQSATIYTPLTVNAGDPEPVPFFREDPFIVGEYLLGFYRWQQPVKLNSAQFIGLSPQVAPAVLTLEVNGNLTAVTLTVPIGVANAPVEVDLDLGGYVVPAGQTVRWKITASDTVDNAAWQAALVMEVTPQ